MFVLHFFALDISAQVKEPATSDKQKSLSSKVSEVCTPKPTLTSQKGVIDSKKQTARKIASMLRNPSALKPKNQASETRRLVEIFLFLL